jgi:hypothetical protein
MQNTMGLSLLSNVQTKQSDLATAMPAAMGLEVPLTALPSLAKLRNIPEGEEKWDCQEQAASTLSEKR